MSEQPDNSPEENAAGTRAAHRGKSDQAFRTISEVATELDVQQHVLRFWETRFNQIKPLKRGGGRRYYRPEDVALLRGIRKLLHDDGYTIKGVQKVLRESGVKAVAAMAGGDPLPAAADPVDEPAVGEPVTVPADTLQAAASTPTFSRPAVDRQLASQPAREETAIRGLDDSSREKLSGLLEDLKAMRESLKGEGIN
jgi:DNA-binding transcriptional MerR regulator